VNHHKCSGIFRHPIITRTLTGVIARSIAKLYCCLVGRTFANAPASAVAILTSDPSQQRTGAITLKLSHIQHPIHLRKPGRRHLKNHLRLLHPTCYTNLSRSHINSRRLSLLPIHRRSRLNNITRALAYFNIRSIARTVAGAITRKHF